MNEERKKIWIEIIELFDDMLSANILDPISSSRREKIIELRTRILDNAEKNGVYYRISK